VDTQADNPYIEKLKKSVSRILPGEQVELTVAHGGSDGRYFFYKGIPAVELGPKGNYWHGDDEYVEQESIEQLERILIDFARSF
jgi:acetylornithine deacetylase/succinyl-diaminopimelate desuccinylase-like protein